MSEAEILNGGPLSLDDLNVFQRKYDAKKKHDEDEELKQAALEQEKQALTRAKLANELL